MERTVSTTEAMPPKANEEDMHQTHSHAKSFFCSLVSRGIFQWPLGSFHKNGWLPQSHKADPMLTAAMRGRAAMFNFH
jgi:hypothetical protein